MISTRLTRLLGIAHPIVHAGASNPAFAAAISEAGALGVLDVRGSTHDEAARAIDACRERTDRPFAVRIEALGLSTRSHAIFERVLQARPRVVFVAAGDASAASTCKEHAITVLAEVDDAHDIEGALAAHADVLVLANRELGDAALVLAGRTPIVVPCVANTGRELASALVLGASGLRLAERALQEIALASLDDDEDRVNIESILGRLVRDAEERLAGAEELLRPPFAAWDSP